MFVQKFEYGLIFFDPLNRRPYRDRQRFYLVYRVRFYLEKAHKFKMRLKAHFKFVTATAMFRSAERNR